MGQKLTPAQEAAITTRDRTLLISAAAGAGKTFTLTKRIIQRLTDEKHPLSISRLLVVTYTRAAAADLRERIGSALTKAVADAVAKCDPRMVASDPTIRHLRRQLLELPSAHISTIDSFILDPVKANFSSLGLPAKFRIADDAELLPLSDRVMGSLAEEFYHRYAASPDGSLFSLLANNPFADLCDSLTPAKNDETLLPTLRNLYNRLLCFPDGLARLTREAAELEAGAVGDYFDTAHGRFLLEWLMTFCKSAQDFYSDAIPLLASEDKAWAAYGATFRSDADFIDRLSKVQTYRDAYAWMNAYPEVKCTHRTSLSPEALEVRARREALAKDILSLADTYFSDPPEILAEQMQDTATMCRVLYDFLSTYDERFLAEKRARGICDFTDNRRYLLGLLRAEDGTLTPFAHELAAAYDEVYIDEYQDVDEMQDDIFRIIGGDHRFMVGDIKQSIYLFRGADPSVFARYRQSLPSLAKDPSGAVGNSIFMSENFRCDESVIRVTNAVCGHILRACPQSVGYCADDDLRFAKEVPSDGYAPAPVEVTLIRSPVKADGVVIPENAVKRSAVEYEAIYVANRIAQMLRDGEKLSDGEVIRPKDITILMRSKTNLAVYREALMAMGIPTGSDELDTMEAGRDILHGGDMMYLLNLLRVMNNPDQDIPLSETLRAPFPDFSLEDLLNLRRANDRTTEAYSLYECLETYADTENADPALALRVAEFISWIETYRTLCATQPAHGILRLLARDERCACRKTDAFRYLYDAARTYQSNTFVSLFAFLRFFEKKLQITKNAASSVAMDDEDGYVTLMTTHASKGLEFPVCFLVRAGEEFSTKSTESDLIFEKRTGLSMKLYRRTGFLGDGNSTLQSQAKYNTTLRKTGALSLTHLEQEEEMRILYVAMTRARERLFIVGSGSMAMLKQIEAGFAAGDRYNTLAHNKYLSWVLAALEAHPEEAEFFRIHHVLTSDITPDAPLPRRQKKAETVSDTTEEHFRLLAISSLPPSDTEIQLARVPTKIPASRMREMLLDTCFFYDTDHPVDADGKLPETQEDASWCDAMTEKSIREALKLMSSGTGSDHNEFEILLGQNRRPTAAERGTAVHLFLQYADYDRVLAHGVEDEIARLHEEGFINPRTAEILDRAMLQAFFQSRFMTHIRGAVRVERELKFHRFLPLASLTTRPYLQEALGNRTLYVQGSVDLLAIFPDGHIELCDYKTDSVTPVERTDHSLLAARMKERHGEQLRQYVEAIAEMYDTRPTKVYIFSLPLGEAVEIEI